MIDRIKELIENKCPIGSYGIERETLRVDKYGRLSFKPHPKGLGDKYRNPYITTDFSESQIEVITPAFEEPKEVFKFVNDLYNVVAIECEDEYLWPQSMPCEIPEDNKIPVAEFGDEEGAVEAEQYRKKLMEKYGGKKQLISGVHYNFSFSEELVKGLYIDKCNEINYKSFKDDIYLKVTRNYLRYRWLLIYLFGSTSTLHKTYIDAGECTKCFKEIAVDSFVHEVGISYRNGECGYRNLVDLFPDYTSVKSYVESVKNFIKDDLIDSHKELYSQIRLKPRDTKDFFNSLLEDGIKYLEYRTIDVNPFEKSGIALEDLEFLEIFNIFLLIKEESNYSLWQQEALENQNSVAKFGKRDLKLKKNGNYISKKSWALEILEEIKDLNKELNLNKDKFINIMENRIKNVELTYSYRIEELVKKKGYINAYMDLAMKYKLEAIEEIKTSNIYKKISYWISKDL